MRNALFALTALLCLSTTAAAVNKADSLPSIGGISAKELHLDKDGILRYRWGDIATMDQPDAIKACAVHGRHLPTIRELVKLNRSKGLVIQELTEYQRWDFKDSGRYPQSEDESMHLVPSRNPNGTPDLFYYNRENYKRPDGPLRDESFWSSSYDYDGAFRYLGYVLVYDGVIVRSIRTTITNSDGTKVFGTHTAARCVK